MKTWKQIGLVGLLMAVMWQNANAETISVQEIRRMFLEMEKIVKDASDMNYKRATMFASLAANLNSCISESESIEEATKSTEAILLIQEMYQSFAKSANVYANASVLIGDSAEKLKGQNRSFESPSTSQKAGFQIIHMVLPVMKQVTDDLQEWVNDNKDDPIFGQHPPDDICETMPIFVSNIPNMKKAIELSEEDRKQVNEGICQLMNRRGCEE